MIGKNLLSKSRKFWKRVLAKLGDNSVVKSKYCSAKFTESKQKQLTIPSGLQKVNWQRLFLQDCWMQIHCQCAKLRKARRVKMVRFQGLKISTKRKAMKKMFLSFTDKIKANLKQKLASRLRNKEWLD